MAGRSSLAEAENDGGAERRAGRHTPLSSGCSAPPVTSHRSGRWTVPESSSATYAVRIGHGNHLVAGPVGVLDKPFEQFRPRNRLTGPTADSRAQFIDRRIRLFVECNRPVFAGTTPHDFKLSSVQRSNGA